MPSTMPIEINSGMALLGTPTKLCLIPVNTIIVIRRAVFSNTAATPILLTIWKCANGASPTAQNIILDSWTLSVSEAYTSPELANMVLTGGETIYASSTPPSSITAFLSGFLTSQ